MNNSEDFSQLPIAEIPKHVRAELSSFLKAREPQLAQIGKPVTEAIEHLERFVLDGGKRIRPLYAWAGFVAADGLRSEERRVGKECRCGRGTGGETEAGR